MNSEEEFKREVRHHRRRFWMVPLILIAILAKTAVVMFLWNKLIPDLFHGPTLNYIHALGLMVLMKLLVGFGGGFGGKFGRHRHFGPGHHFGRHRQMKKFWAGLSQEERQRLREELRKRCE
jgi:hypothetical protein